MTVDVFIDGVRYIPAENISSAPTGVRFVQVSVVTDMQLAQARASDLHKHGEMVLVWANLDDLMNRSGSWKTNATG